MNKAEQFIASARDAMAHRHWDATVSGAVLAGIAAADAYMVGRHGMRSRGDHREAIQLLRIHGGPVVAERADTLTQLVGKKATAQYGEKMSTEGQALQAIKRAERLIAWAKEALKGAET